MVAVYSTNLQVFNAEQFKESVSEPSSTRLYLTIGRAYPWPNDAAPQQANSSVTSFNEVWDNMIGAKLITGFDISHAIPRHDWTANTSYDAYDHCTCSINLFDTNTKFYIVTSDWNVYKCIANNNGAVSNSMPTSLSTTSTITEIDGYVWKYMYTISPSDRLKFTTSNYIPVKTLTVDDNSLQWHVQQNAVDGAINAIKVLNGGQNYSNANNITITIAGDGKDATAIAQVNTVSNTISNIVMTNPGNGYTYAFVNVSTTGAGTNASFKAIISPPGGHGSDALRELGGSYLILDPKLNGTENGVLSVDNDYRQLSIMKDPYFFGSNTIASNTVTSQLTVLSLNGVSVEYIEDEIVYQGVDLGNSTFSGRVVEWNSANSIIKLSNVRGTPTTDILIGTDSGAARFVDSITNPTLEPRSGRLIYIDNIKPIQRDADQIEDFKIVLKF